MKKYKLLYLSAVTLTCTMLILASCKCIAIRSTSVKKGGVGPPPHAPAHGYRHKHHGLELVYDSGRGVYVVVGLANHYYYKNHYYRFHEPNWQASIHIDGPWEFVSKESLPPGLRGKGKPKEHTGRGHGTQKK